MGEMDKSRELNSKEGDNSSRFEGKSVPWEHTICAIQQICTNYTVFAILMQMFVQYTTIYLMQF